MVKTITISGKEYKMKSSAYTQFKYKNDTGRKMLKDLEDLTKLQNEGSLFALDTLDEISDVILKMAYTMIEEADPSQVKGYDEFLKSIENLLENTDWMIQVIELAIAPISGGN